jgi:hypothetical protein
MYMKPSSTGSPNACPPLSGSARVGDLLPGEALAREPGEQSAPYRRSPLTSGVRPPNPVSNRRGIGAHRSHRCRETHCGPPGEGGTLAGMTTTVMVRRVRGATNVGAGAMELAPA